MRRCARGSSRAATPSDGGGGRAEEHGATVVTAASGPEAIDALGADAPDVLVSDLGMPGMDGYAFIREVRATGGHVPAVAVTAFARPEDRQRALSAGYQ